jgi:hypothetical protein
LEYDAHECWLGVQAQLNQIRSLESAAKEAETKRTTYEDVTLQVKRLWDTLCDDIVLLAKHAIRGMVRPRYLGRVSLYPCTAKVLRPGSANHNKGR